jgi:hypothetical protein
VRLSSLRAPLPVLRAQLRDLLQFLEEWPQVAAALDGIADWPGMLRYAEDALASADLAYIETIEADGAVERRQVRQDAWIVDVGAYLGQLRRQWSIAANGDQAAAEIARRLPLAGNPRFAGRKRALVEAIRVVQAHRGSLTTPPAWLARSEVTAEGLLQSADNLDEELALTGRQRSAAAARTALAREATRLALQQLREGWELARRVNRTLPVLRMDAVATYWQGRAPEVGGELPPKPAQRTGTGVQQGGTGVQRTGTGVQEGGTGAQRTGMGAQESGTGVQRTGMGAQEGGTGAQEGGTGVQEGGTGHTTPLHTHTTALHTHTTALHTHTTALRTHTTLLHTHPTPLHTHTTPLHTHPTPLHTHPTPLHTHPTPLHTFGAEGGPLPQPAGPPAPPNRTPTDGSDP